MDMHAAATAPRSPHISEQDRKHPLFPEYQRHLSSCARLLIEASRFDDWLGCRERRARDDETVQHPQYPAFLAWMRAHQGGARKCPGGNSFPGNFHYWLTGARW